MKPQFLGASGLGREASSGRTSHSGEMQEDFLEEETPRELVKGNQKQGGDAQQRKSCAQRWDGSGHCREKGRQDSAILGQRAVPRPLGCQSRGAGRQVRQGWEVNQEV